MKTKTLSILFALVMVLSLAFGVSAQSAFDETWDEETVLTVFSDLDMVFPDLFADEDSNYLFVDDPFVQNFPTGSNGDIVSKDVAEEDVDGYSAKAVIDPDNATLTAEYSPCGDGLIKFDMTVQKGTAPTGYYAGSDYVTYIRSILANVTVDDGNGSTQTYSNLKIKKCTSSGGDSCRALYFNAAGEARLKGYIQLSDVIPSIPSTGEVTVEINITNSAYMTALWDAPILPDTITATATKSDGTVTESSKNYCQTSLEAFGMGNVSAVRARYDENTGEARLQATIRNLNSTDKLNYVIPAEVMVGTDRYTDYVCKYTIYNTTNGAPRTDYCEFGKGIAIAPNGVVRFDITIDHLSGVNEGDLSFTFRVGGMTSLITGTFEPVSDPCPVVTRISVMNPLKPFMTYYAQEEDDAIKPSGAYGVYEGGVWGMYQKCGRMAYLAVRVQNDGVQDEVLNLDHVAVAINGGTPISFKWVMATEPAARRGNEIVLEAGNDVVLIGRAHVTDMPSQLNADTSMTAAVNFLDYGLYISGKVYSDHNNTNCVRP